MNAPMRDWDAMGSDWRGQAVPSVDVEALRAEATQQGRRLRRTLVLETLLAVFVLLLLGWIAFQPDAVPMETWLFGSLAAAVVPYHAYTLWLRRRQWSEAGLDVDALLDVEARRCTTTLHYWRVGLWGVLAIWLVVFVVMCVGMYDAWPERQINGLMRATWVNVFFIPMIGLYGLNRCKQARVRLERLVALRKQLT